MQSTSRYQAVHSIVSLHLGSAERCGQVAAAITNDLLAMERENASAGQSWISSRRNPPERPASAAAPISRRANVSSHKVSRCEAESMDGLIVEDLDDLVIPARKITRDAGTSTIPLSLAFRSLANDELVAKLSRSRDEALLRLEEATSKIALLTATAAVLPQSKRADAIPHLFHFVEIAMPRVAETQHAETHTEPCVIDHPSAVKETRIESNPANSILLKSQQAIISSLEAEVMRLRQERDFALGDSQMQLSKLVQELEEARDRLGESSAEWADKSKELNRLRTLMKFSQLKRDSDKLQETYARVDELETLLRRQQSVTARTEFDREEYQRLRYLETHVRSLAERGGSLTDLPVSLLGYGTAERKAAASPARSTAVERPPPVKASPSQALTLVKPEAVTVPADRTVELHAEPARAPCAAQPPDVSFSEIADRMRRFLERKRHPVPTATEAIAPKKSPRGPTAPSQRVRSAGTTRSASAAPVTSTPSKSQSQARPTSASMARVSSVAGIAPPKGFVLIAGRLVPMYK